VTVGHLIVLAGTLFTLGMIGVLSRRNILIVLLSVELMLNAAAVAFCAFASRWQNLDGQVMVFFVIAVAAAEVAVGLAVVIALFRLRVTVDADKVSLLKR
jgi:NADH-quinone oxidoreductase subunit K